MFKYVELRARSRSVAGSLLLASAHPSMDMVTEHDDEPLPEVSPADALAIDKRVELLASSASLLELRSLSLKPIVSLQAREGPVPALSVESRNARAP